MTEAVRFVPSATQRRRSGFRRIGIEDAYLLPVVAVLFDEAEVVGGGLVGVVGRFAVEDDVQDLC